MSSATELYPSVHGTLGKAEWSMPAKLAKDCADYEESTENLLKEKVKILQLLLSKSRSTVMCVDFEPSSNTKPNLCHHIFVMLHCAGLVSKFVTFDQSAFLQRAGVPQSAVTEINGSLFDPSNPVFHGEKRENEILVSQLLRNASLFIVFGSRSDRSSLIDTLVTAMNKESQSSTTFGSISVYTQKTSYDKICSLKIFASTEKILTMLAKELNILPPVSNVDDVSRVPSDASKTHIFDINYDEEGNFRPNTVTSLDLRQGALVKITAGRYAGFLGKLTGLTAEGHYEIFLQHEISSRIKTEIKMMLGSWWILDALEGKIKRLPVVSASAAKSFATHVEKHGSLGDKSWPCPTLATFCPESARPGYVTCQAHEYLEASPDVLRAKVKMLASLLKRSKCTILYTGAGISTASGIPDYATKATSTLAGAASGLGRQASPILARPTLSHRVLVALYHAGLIKGWIQQNHDGLPQKAGLPQSAINEIHGAWFDPSNPVVPMKGNLRSDLFEQLLNWEQEADLCIVLGTSLAGMNADRVAISAGKRGLQGTSLGTVIVNLQRTSRDNLASLRIFSRLDDVMVMLAEELSIPNTHYIDDDAHDPLRLLPSVPPDCFTKHVYHNVPYDRHGRLCTSARTVLDLRDGAVLKLTAGPYCGDYAVVQGKPEESHYRLVVEHVEDGQLERFCFALGLWWIEAAVTGSVPQLPVVNVTSDSEATAHSDRVAGGGVSPRVPVSSGGGSSGSSWISRLVSGFRSRGTKR